MSEVPITREHERFAFLEEESYDRVSAYLNEHAEDLGPDNKTSYFFVLPDINISVAVTEQKAVLKYKGGQIGKGIGFEELEIGLASREEAEKTVRLLQVLTQLDPQVSRQIRHNYQLDEIELALKYTETWGFHLELEKIYEATDEELKAAATEADSQIVSVAGRLGIQLATNADLLEFTQAWERNKQPRGTYTAEEVFKLYGTLHKQAAVKRLSETQVLDEATIEWLKSQRDPELSVPHGPLLLSDLEKQTLATLDLPTNWFASEERRETIHGQLHLARVAAFAAHLAREQGKDELTAQTVFVAGLFHDIARTSDKTDRGHGARSAEWLKANSASAEVHQTLGEVVEGVDFNRVASIVAAHDEEGLESDDIAIIKAADALDRYRLPKTKWWLNDEYLTLVPSSETKSLAFDTIVATEEAWLQNRDIVAATRNITQEL